MRKVIYFLSRAPFPSRFPEGASVQIWPPSPGFCQASLQAEAAVTQVSLLSLFHGIPPPPPHLGRRPYKQLQTSG